MAVGLGTRLKLFQLFSSLLKRADCGFEHGAVAMTVMHVTTELPWSVVSDSFHFQYDVSQKQAMRTRACQSTVFSHAENTNQWRSQTFLTGGSLREARIFCVRGH